jgi:hypothetical protein
MKRTMALLLLVAARWPSGASAQPPPGPQPTVMTLRPAAEPVPALKYRLVPEHIKLVPGNAAIFYHRGVIIMSETFSSLRAKEKARPGAFPDSVVMLASDTWLNCPLGEIPRDKARKYLEPFQNALQEVELGALRSSCDWEFDQRPGEGTDLQLPELQEMRQLGRLMRLKVRLAILDGKTDEAMHWIETGLVMGRHASQGPLWIQALIGIGIDRLMTSCFEELIQASDGPSLYWALADRPRPFIDMRRSMEGERHLLERELPELNDLDRGAWSLDQARQFADTLQRKLFDLASGRAIPGTYFALPIGLSDLFRRMRIAVMAAKIYPEARRALIARGRPEAQVGAMPVIQVAALYSLEEYQRIRDGSYKWTNVPYWQSYNQIDRAILSPGDEKLANPLFALFLMLTPPLNSVRLQAILLERQLDAMQCIEAIRLYANDHEGKLPNSLEAITDAPVPLDPATGKSFLYQVNGDSAILSAPAPPGFNDPYTWRSWQSYAMAYELKLAR